MTQETEQFDWSEDRERAAQLLSEDRLTDDEIAVQVNVSRSTLARWKRHPMFTARIDEHLAAFRARVMSRGIARRERRVAALDDRWSRMQRVMDERAAEMEKVPGGGSGILVRTIKGIGKGADFQVVEEYAVDAGLLKECREHEKQAAQELGQWTEKPEAPPDDFIIDLSDDDAPPEGDPAQPGDGPAA